MRRIADQQLSLESLVENLSLKADNEEVSQVLDKLLVIQEAFDLLYENQNVPMTEEQFKEISKQIKAFRNEIIN